MQSLDDFQVVLREMEVRYGRDVARVLSTRATALINMDPSYAESPDALRRAFVSAADLLAGELNRASSRVVPG